MKAEIEVSGAGRGGRVVLDGADVSKGVRGLTIRAGLGQVTQVELDLSVFDVTEFESDAVQILIPDHTRDALIALGWTPPPEG